MTEVLHVTIDTAERATVAGESVAKGRHRTISDAAMDRCKEIARARRERVAVRAKSVDGREHWVWAYQDGKVAQMDPGEIKTAERETRSTLAASEPSAGPGASPTGTAVDNQFASSAFVLRAGHAADQGQVVVTAGGVVTTAASIEAGGHLPTGHLDDRTESSPGVTSPAGQFGVIGTQPVPTAAPVSPSRVLPTFEDVLEAAEQSRDIASSGWRAVLRLPPGRAERERCADRAVIKRSDLDGPRTVVVVNVKGGVGKTTTTRHLAAAIGSAKGGYTIAIDANPSRGNLANRCKPAEHKKTVIDLLDDIERFQRADARIGELSTFVRPQDELFDVLSSDQNPKRMETLGLTEFAALDAVTDKFYRIKIIDTGNDFRHVAYQAALDVAHGLVIACEVAEDSFEGASWTVDALRDNGYGQLVDNGVAVLIRTSPRRFRGLETRTRAYFAAHCREVVIAPYDPHHLGGKRILQSRLSPLTVRAAEKAAAAVVRGLPAHLT